MTDFRLVPCEACEGSGREWQRAWTYELGCGFAHEDVADVGPCPDCKGLGEKLVPYEPRTLDDIEEEDAEMGSQRIRPPHDNDPITYLCPPQRKAYSQQAVDLVSVTLAVVVGVVLSAVINALFFE